MQMRNQLFADAINAISTIDSIYNEDSVDYVQFSQTWPSTALCFGGCGGDMMMKAVMTVVYSETCAYVYCNKRLAYTIRHPNEKFFNDVRDRKIASKNEALAKYESEIK